MNSMLLTDFYKVHHNLMYPEGTTMIYSNLTARKSRLPGVDSIVVFGIQHFLREYLVKGFNEGFFNRDLAEIIAEYKEEINVDTTHIEDLHKLGYLPIEIKALHEGSVCPIGVPCLTIVNTDSRFGWLTNYLETLISCMLWQPITSATVANEYFKLLSRYAVSTVGSDEFVPWQAHDFSMRGMSSLESAIISGMGHLAAGLTGSDNIPAIYQAKKSYFATGLIGASVPATEHSVMCMGSKDDEIGTFKSLLKKYPTGLLSVVSDTWDLWKVLTEYLPAIKNEIMSRDGKLVIRPDSGDPVDILCGLHGSEYHHVQYRGDKPTRLIDNATSLGRDVTDAEIKGVIELLWDEFGGTVNELGYKVLDSHIGAIYGDSITLDRAEQICERLKVKGFASTNVVFGIGSYTYQYNTRDTFGFAIKATYGEVNGIGQEIFKDPITDDGTKKSAKGLLRVISKDGIFKLEDQQTWDMERTGYLVPVFKNGKILRESTLDDIRYRIKGSR